MKISEEEIDNVDIAFKMKGMIFDRKTINRIIILVALVKEKGGLLTIEDIMNIKDDRT